LDKWFSGNGMKGFARESGGPPARRDKANDMVERGGSHGEVKRFGTLSIPLRIVQPQAMEEDGFSEKCIGIFSREPRKSWEVQVFLPSAVS